MQLRPWICVPATRILAAVSLFSAGAAAAQVSNQSDELDRYAAAAQQVRHFQGVVLVAKDGMPVLEKGYGAACIEQDVPNTPQTRFLIGSVTKQFTAAAILQLQEQGKLDVRDPVAKYLPAYPKDPGERITIRHLLSHTAGLPNYTDDAELMARRTVDLPLDQLVASFHSKPLQFEPGTQWRYSNSGYVLLGLIVEAVSGQSYEEYLQEHILTPLGMRDSGYTHNESIIKNRACGHASSGDGWTNAPRIAMSLPYAAGALYATARDLLRWDQALYGTSVLTEESKQQMFTPVLENYGYGWVMLDRSGHRVMVHDGGIDGFTSHLARYPDDQLTVIVLCNNESIQASSVGFALASIMFGQPYDLPVRKTPAAIDLALLNDYPGAYDIGENQYRVIRREGDGLYSQRSGGPVFRIFPEAKDRFFYKNDNATTITFVRDGQGAVMAHVIHQRGVDARFEKLSGFLADSLLAEKAVAAIDPLRLARYAGEYELAPGFVLTFRTEGGRFFSRATGQDEFEVFPTSDTEFFVKVVDARISFQVSGGAVLGLILHQAGQDMPAKKIK